MGEAEGVSSPERGQHGGEGRLPDIDKYESTWTMRFSNFIQFSKLVLINAYQNSIPTSELVLINAMLITNFQF